MTSVTTTIRIDKEEKEKADALYASLGLTLSQAFKLFVRKSLIEGGLPFEVSAPSKRLQEAMNSQDYTYFDNAEQAMDWLND